MDNIKQRFGSRVKDLRTSKGWSQEKLSQESGLDRTYIGGVERGERNVSLINIEKIATSLEVHISQLMEF